VALFHARHVPGLAYLYPMQERPIGVFDSGYGGLTILRELVNRMPQYDYLYLGDNARAPYGNRSFGTVYRYTLQAVEWFFRQGCPLVILACNTASAKALRTIQQNDLERIAPGNRVLGVIRPTTEIVGEFSSSGSIGILGTTGTVLSDSYGIEIAKFFPGTRVHQQDCPMWVPLVENREYASPGADYFVQDCLAKLFARDPKIDTVLLACTHYPLLIGKIRQFLPPEVKLVSQGPIVAESLEQYLFRHPSMAERLSQGGGRRFFTTDSTEDFDNHASIFFGENLSSVHMEF
jgi:glutamate racemase